MKERKYLPLFFGGLSIMALAPASAEMIKSDSGLAGKSFCWPIEHETEVYNRNHTYLHNTQGVSQKVYSDAGAWTIGKDGTVTIKLVGVSTLLRRYDFDGDHVKELTGSLRNGSAPGIRC